MIYLDNAATSFPKPESVYETVDRFGRTLAGNPGRGGHRLSLGSARTIEDARRAVATLLGARHPERVIFTLNATDALNMAIKGMLRPGDHAVTSDLEHNSVSRPLEGLAVRGLITLTRLRSDDRGRIEPASLREAMTAKTRLVALCHASNVLGVVQDAATLAEETHKAGAVILFDASQSAGVMPIDVEAMGIDLLAITGHKALLGPMGTGALIVRDGVEISAWREGGTGGDSSSPTQPTLFPHYLEGGTPNALGLAGLEAGVRFVLDRGAGAIGRHEREMASRLARALVISPRVHILAAPPGAGDADQPVRSSEAGAQSSRNMAEACGERDERSVAAPVRGQGTARVQAALGLVAFTIDGYTPQEAAAILDESFGVAVRSGMHCAPYIHKRHGLFPDGTIRASAGAFTKAEEIDEAARAILALAGE